MHLGSLPRSFRRVVAPRVIVVRFLSSSNGESTIDAINPCGVYTFSRVFTYDRDPGFLSRRFDSSISRVTRFVRSIR